VLPSKFGHSGFARKNLIPRVPPFKVTQGHWNWHGSIGFLLLPISDPWINGDFGRKSQSFPTSRVFNAPLTQLPVKFCNGGSAKNRVMPLSDDGKSLTSAFVYIQYHKKSNMRDIRMNGQMDGFALKNIALCIHKNER